MIRQNLSEDSAYADAIAHGDGLICLQYRTEKGGTTYDVPFPVKKLVKMRLTRSDDVFSLEISDQRTLRGPQRQDARILRRTQWPVRCLVNTHQGRQRDADDLRQ